MKLSGALSQGIILPTNVVSGVVSGELTPGMDVTELMRYEVWEPEVELTGPGTDLS